MKKFGENLARYRKRAGYTQEGLAEALEVSRQAVGKWEAGTAYPSAEKLPVIADILSCSLDTLLRGEETSDAEETSAEDEDAHSENGKNGASWEEVFMNSEGGREAFAMYDAHKNQFSLKITVGVAMVLSGISAMLLIEPNSEVLAICVFLIIVAIAVAMFITAGMSESAFWQDYPAVPDLYSKDQKRRFRNIFGIGIAGSVAVVLIDVAVLTLTGTYSEGNEAMEIRSVAYFMMVLAGAVAALVYLGIQYSKYNMEGKRKIIVPEEDEYDTKLEQAIDQKIENELNRAMEEIEKDRPDWSGTIMLSATIVFLIAGFVFHAWEVSWVAFPVGGLLCAIVGNMQKMKK